MQIETFRKEQERPKIKKKIDFEFQLLGLELQEMFPEQKRGSIWSLFYKFPVPLIRDSMKVYLKQDIRSFRYFMGILYKS